MLKDFCFLNNDEILAVFHARSQPEIYSFLGDFSGRKNELKAFKNFINYLKTQNDKKYYAIYENGSFLGVICFFDITKTAAQIGFYKNPDFKKVGDILIKNLLNHAYELGLKELFARVKKDNEKSLNLLKNSHFLELGILDDQIILAKNLFYSKTCKNFLKNP